MRDFRPLRRSGGLSAFLVLVAGTTPPDPVLGGEIPTTAYQRSVRTPSALLDQFALTFLYPQLSPSYDRRLVATATSSTSTVDGAGVNARPGEAGLFVLVQDFETYTASRDPFRFGTDTLPLFQIGAASRLGRARIGLAVRGGYGRALDEDIDEDEDDGEIRRRELTSDLRTRYGELAVGLGFGERSSIDLVGELYRESSEQHEFEYYDYPFPPRVDREGRVETVPRTRYRLAGRARIRVGESGWVRVAGSYRDETTEYRAVIRTDDHVGRHEGGGYGRTWSVSTSYEEELEALGFVRAFGEYLNREGPSVLSVSTGGFSSGGGLSVARLERHRVSFGFGLERPIWWELMLLAGFENSFTLDDETRRSASYRGEVNEDKEVTEVMDQFFSWGLRREFRRLEIVGSMSTNLAVTNLFFNLDIGFRF